jgi:hypothetical protein
MAVGADDAFYGVVLNLIGAPVNATNLAVMQAWAASEGSRAAWNPFNTSQTLDRTVHPNRKINATLSSAGVREYRNETDGAAATASNLLNGFYPDIVKGFKESNAPATIAAIVQSPWAASHYNAQSRPGGYVASTSTLWKVYEQNTGSGTPVNNGPSLWDRLTQLSPVGSIAFDLTGGHPVETAVNAASGITSVAQLGQSFLAGFQWIQANLKYVGIALGAVVLLIVGFLTLNRGTVGKVASVAAVAA